MKLSQSLVLTSLLLSSLPAYSQLGPIVVTGTKTEQLASESAVPVEIISREQIENSVATDVADIIQMHSSLEVARSGDYGKQTSMFIRGAESNHTLILIDGVKINSATTGAPALQNISPDMIDHIEIVKGPRSSLYGSEAIGGVVNIITRKAIEGKSASVTLGAGENGTTKINLSALYGNDQLSSGITLEQFNTDGFPIDDSSSEDHGFDNATINTFVDYKLERSNIRLSHWSAQGNVEYYSFGDELDQDFENSVTALAWNFNINDQLQSHLRVSAMTDDIQQNQLNYLSELDHATTNRDEVDLKLDYRRSTNLTLSLGLLSAKEQVDAVSFGTTIDESTDISATYALMQGRSGAHKYAIAARATDHEDFGQNNNWNMDYQFAYSQALSLHAGAGTAFRAPDHTDRFGFYGNPNLRPETSKSMEIGSSYINSSGSKVSFTYFDTRIEDLIELDSGFTQMVNIDEARIKGSEIAYQADRINWSYSLNLLIQDPRNQANNAVLSRRAKERLGLNLAYHREQWQVGGDISIVGERDNSGYDDIVLDRYKLVNVFTRFQYSQPLSISAKIENLFDEDYETASGYNTKGRTAYLELTYNFAD